MRLTKHVFWPGLALLSLLAGCANQRAARTNASGAASATAAPAYPIQFTDVTAAAGIRFQHTNGAFGVGLQPETMGSGVAFIDYNGDGYQDLFFVNSRHWTDAEIAAWKNSPWTRREVADFKRLNPPGTPLTRRVPINMLKSHVTGALYLNNGDGTFRDVTAGSGLEVEMYGMGVAVGDYDNDRKPDLYVTSYGRNYLFRNQSTSDVPKFHDVSAEAGVRDAGWGSSAAWIDYDKDGRLDLFVCRFMKWAPAKHLYASVDGIHRGYVYPIFFKGEPSRLYHNEGNGRFKDVSAQAGVAMESKGLAVATCDYNDDGWPDIVVANDSHPDFLFRNDKDGTFTEVGRQVGIAYDNDGRARAGMGLDTADIDHSNRDSIVVSNFAQEGLGLYHNRAKGLFVDVAPETDIGPSSDKYLSWGVAFSDVNNDGWPDIFVANGHVNDQFNIGGEGITQAQRPLLFLNDRRGGRFPEIGRQAGEAMQRPLIARGLATADFDLDGDVDVVLTVSGGPAILLRNDSTHHNHALRLVLRGTQSNASGIGTLVKVKLTPNDGLRRWVRSGSSYLSQGELPLTLGLGAVATVPQLSLYWPSGTVTRLEDVAAGQTIVVQEGKGIVKQQPLQSQKADEAEA